MPVLSKIAVRTEETCSKATGLLTMIAREAHKEIEPRMAMGIARSRGQGVATTRTERKRVESPEKYQAAMATSKATGVNQAPIWPPSRRIVGRVCSDSCMTSMIRA